MMSRLSRKQIKRDEMVETVGTMVDYGRQHTRALAWGALVVAVVALVAAGIYLVGRQRSAQATAVLAEAMAVENDETTARDRFQEVVDRFPRSTAADVARLYLARLAAKEGDAERARELWQTTIRHDPDGALGVQARLNLWELARGQGNNEELLAELRALLEGEGSGLGEDQLLYQLALTLEAQGSAVEARDAYLRLVEEHPGSVLRGVAQERADRLGGAAAGIG